MIARSLLMTCVHTRPQGREFAGFLRALGLFFIMIDRIHARR